MQHRLATCGPDAEDVSMLVEGSTAPVAPVVPWRTPPGAFAALDLGTNNCRMLIGAASGEGFRVLESFSRIVRLGEGLHATGRLSEQAMERALTALETCAGRLSRRPVKSMRAVATEACRRAENGPEFLARVKERTGSPSTSSPPGRRPNSHWRVARRCWRAMCVGHYCSTSVVDQPNWPGCG